MSQKERNEWIERAKQRVLNNAEITDQSVKEIMFLFDEAAWTLETEINSMFQKYATENGLTNAEASKLLTGSEYSRWKKGIEEYLKEAEGDSQDTSGTEHAGNEVADQQEGADACYRLPDNDNTVEGYGNEDNRSAG